MAETRPRPRLALLRFLISTVPSLASGDPARPLCRHPLLPVDRSQPFSRGLQAFDERAAGAGHARHPGLPSPGVPLRLIRELKRRIATTRSRVLPGLDVL